jgi:hypothetical protein
LGTARDLEKAEE